MCYFQPPLGTVPKACLLNEFVPALRLSTELHGTLKGLGIKFSEDIPNYVYVNKEHIKKQQ